MNETKVYIVKDTPVKQAGKFVQPGEEISLSANEYQRLKKFVVSPAEYKLLSAEKKSALAEITELVETQKQKIEALEKQIEDQQKKVQSLETINQKLTNKK